MAAADQIDAIIANALAVAAAKAEESANYSDRADTAARGSSNFSPTPIVFSPAQVEPPVMIPTSATGVDSALYGSTYQQIVDDLTQQFTDFFATYFPNECDYLEKAQTTLCDMLDGKTGIPTHVEDQIWQRDRARVLNEVQRGSNEIVANFAARGFPMPPGAAQHQMHLMQQDAQNKIGQQSRDIAIKHVEILIENIKFAVQQALDYRIKGIAAAADYIKTLAVGPEIAMRLATSAADAQAKLISAANTYYGSRIRLEELKVDVLKFNKAMVNDAGISNVKEFGERLKARANVLAAAAQAAGSQAAAALNAVHASAQVAVQEEAA